MVHWGITFHKHTSSKNALLMSSGKVWGKLKLSAIIWHLHVDILPPSIVTWACPSHVQYVRHVRRNICHLFPKSPCWFQSREFTGMNAATKSTSRMGRFGRKKMQYRLKLSIITVSAIFRKSIDLGQMVENYFALCSYSSENCHPWWAAIIQYGTELSLPLSGMIFCKWAHELET